MESERVARTTDLANQAVHGLAGPLQDLLTQLLVYKSILMGKWFESLANRQDDPRVRETLLVLHVETIEQAANTIQAVRAWDAVPGGPRAIDDLGYGIRARLLEDLLLLKEGGTTTMLSVAMRAPTEQLRQAFLDLADIDRRHGDLLRPLLGVEGVQARLTRQPSTAQALAKGAHEGRFAEGLLSQSVQATIDRLVQGGHAPSRLLLSLNALRHLRDEGRVDTEFGTAFGLQVDIDFGWSGETFAVLTRERASLAEIISATRSDG